MTTTERSRNWRDNAACRDEDPELFFPLPGADQGAARAICARCPVRSECAGYAMQVGAVGIWGGADEDERRPARRKRSGSRTRAASGAPRRDDDVPQTRQARSSNSVDDVDEHTRLALACYPRVAGQVDAQIVRALARGDGPAMASRWETALAGVALMSRGVSRTAAARLLGEDVNQLTRWRDRALAGAPLVAAGGGMISLRRPARAVGPQTPPRVHAGHGVMRIDGAA